VLAEQELVIGEVVLQELRRAMSTRLNLPAAITDHIERLLREHTVVAKPTKFDSIGIRDQDDEWILASAVLGRADVLVTGDDDLLSVKSKAPIPILSPREFWEFLRSQKPAGDGPP
jgi:putative PIN family toxin of toxin-antitoxin system